MNGRTLRANRLALQRGRRNISAVHRFASNERNRRARIDGREIDALFPLIRRIHASGNHIIFFSQQSWDNAVPILRHPRAFHFHLGAKGVHIINFKTFKFTLGVQIVEGGVGAFGANLDLCDLLGLGPHGSPCQKGSGSSGAEQGFHVNLLWSGSCEASPWILTLAPFRAQWVG